MSSRIFGHFCRDCPFTNPVTPHFQLILRGEFLELAMAAIYVRRLFIPDAVPLRKCAERTGECILSTEAAGRGTIRTTKVCRKAGKNAYFRQQIRAEEQFGRRKCAERPGKMHTFDRSCGQRDDSDDESVQKGRENAYFRQQIRAEGRFGRRKCAGRPEKRILSTENTGRRTIRTTEVCRKAGKMHTFDSRAGGFTQEELFQLKGALCDLSDKIRKAADRL